MTKPKGKSKKFRIFWISRDNVLVRLTKDQIIRLQESYMHRGQLVETKGVPWILRQFSMAGFMNHQDLASGDVKRLVSANGTLADAVAPLRPKRRRKPRFCPNSGVFFH